MPPHRIRPLPERHFADFALPMQIKPCQNGFSLFAARRMVAGEIGKPLIILQHHAAVLLAVPQARLGLNTNIFAALRCQHVIHVSDQGFTTRTPIFAGFLFGGMATGRAKNQRAHGAC
jgi:hypothetical protein